MFNSLNNQQLFTPFVDDDENPLCFNWQQSDNETRKFFTSISRNLLSSYYMYHTVYIFQFRSWIIGFNVTLGLTHLYVKSVRYYRKYISEVRVVLWPIIYG